MTMLLIQYGANTNIQDKTGGSALYIACANHKIEIVVELLKANADPNVKTKNGWTPLMISTKKNYTDIVDVLLQHGADPNFPLPTGETPLTSASKNEFIETVKLLLKYPAVDIDGDRALAFAANKGHRDIVDLLLPICQKKAYQSVSQTSLASSASSGIESDRGSIITGTTISSGSTTADTASLSTGISVDSGIEVEKKKITKISHIRSVSQISLVSATSSGIESDMGSIITGITSPGSTTADTPSLSNVDSGIKVEKKKVDHIDGASIISGDSGVGLGKKSERKEKYEQAASPYWNRESVRKIIEEACVTDPTLQ